MKSKLITLIIFLGMASLMIFASAQIIDEDSIEISIDLEEGWNLVSNGVFAHPITLAFFQFESEIKQQDIRAIYYYDVSDKKYYQVYPNDENKIIGSNKGYTIIEEYVPSAWIYSERKGILNFRTDDIVKISERKLGSGWNLISITPTFMGNSLDDLRGTCDIQRAYIWWNERQEWQDFSNNLDEEFYEGAAIGRL